MTNTELPPDPRLTPPGTADPRTIGGATSARSLHEQACLDLSDAREALMNAQIVDGERASIADGIARTGSFLAQNALDLEREERYARDLEDIEVKRDARELARQLENHLTELADLPANDASAIPATLSLLTPMLLSSGRALVAKVREL